MQMISLFNSTTAAVVSGGIAVDHGMALTFVADGTLAAGETIPIEVQTSSGWMPVMKSDVPVELTAGENPVSTDKPGIYRANKPVTVAAVGVVVYR